MFLCLKKNYVTYVLMSKKNYVNMSLCLKSTEGAVIAAARLAATAAGPAAILRLDGLVGQPLDARRHQAAGGYGAFGLRPFALGDELDADGLHLLLEVEVGFVGDAPGLQRVAEGARPSRRTLLPCAM